MMACSPFHTYARQNFLKRIDSNEIAFAKGTFLFVMPEKTNM